MATKFLTRRVVGGIVAAVVALAALAALASAGTTSVTKARLERSLPVAFSNQYVQQAKILGHSGITVASLHAKTSCDKGGPKVADVGPGADWICLMSWTDPNVPLPDGTAKFELNVHSNNCYTAGGPSKFIGTLTITDANGKDVDNPVFEFDACFDPHASNVPTGVDFTKPASASLSPTQAAEQSAFLTLPSGTMAADADGSISPTLNCSPGHDGCAGTLVAKVGGKTVATDYIVGPDDHTAVKIALPKGARGSVELTATPVIGRVPKPTSTITLTQR